MILPYCTESAIKLQSVNDFFGGKGLQGRKKKGGGKSKWKIKRDWREGRAGKGNVKQLEWRKWWARGFGLLFCHKSPAMYILLLQIIVAGTNWLQVAWKTESGLEWCPTKLWLVGRCLHVCLFQAVVLHCVKSESVCSVKRHVCWDQYLGPTQ